MEKDGRFARSSEACTDPDKLQPMDAKPSPGSLPLCGPVDAWDAMTARVLFLLCSSSFKQDSWFMASLLLDFGTEDFTAFAECVEETGADLADIVAAYLTNLRVVQHERRNARRKHPPQPTALQSEVADTAKELIRKVAAARAAVKLHKPRRRKMRRGLAEETAAEVPDAEKGGEDEDNEDHCSDEDENDDEAEQEDDGSTEAPEQGLGERVGSSCSEASVCVGSELGRSAQSSQSRERPSLTGECQGGCGQPARTAHEEQLALLYALQGQQAQDTLMRANVAPAVSSQALGAIGGAALPQRAAAVGATCSAGSSSKPEAGPGERLNNLTGPASKPGRSSSSMTPAGSAPARIADQALQTSLRAAASAAVQQAPLQAQQAFKLQQRKPGTTPQQAPPAAPLSASGPSAAARPAPAPPSWSNAANPMTSSSGSQPRWSTLPQPPPPPPPPPSLAPLQLQQVASGSQGRISSLIALPRASAPRERASTGMQRLVTLGPETPSSQMDRTGRQEDVALAAARSAARFGQSFNRAFVPEPLQVQLPAPQQQQPQQHSQPTMWQLSAAPVSATVSNSGVPMGMTGAGEQLQLYGVGALSSDAGGGMTREMHTVPPRNSALLRMVSTAADGQGGIAVQLAPQWQHQQQQLEEAYLASQQQGQQRVGEMLLQHVVSQQQHADELLLQHAEVLLLQQYGMLDVASLGHHCGPASGSSMETIAAGGSGPQALMPSAAMLSAPSGSGGAPRLHVLGHMPAPGPSSGAPGVNLAGHSFSSSNQPVLYQWQ